MQGYLIPIGGAEDTRRTCAILSQFVQLCGGNQARIVVIPSASSFPMEGAQEYTGVFTRFGAHEVRTLHLTQRSLANDPAILRLLDGATGVYLGGGDQLRLMSLMGGTRLHDALLKQFQGGMTVGGTSAGASIMSRHMIAFGRSGAVPSQRMVQMAAGLGLSDLIIDQHFTRRNRLGRLLTAVALNPGSTGVGIDEDTALVIAPDGTQTVIGCGTVTVVDSQNLEYSDLYAAPRYQAFTLKGVDVRVMCPVSAVS